MTVHKLGFSCGSDGKNLPAMQETQARPLDNQQGPTV